MTFTLALPPYNMIRHSRKPRFGLIAKDEVEDRKYPNCMKVEGKWYATHRGRRREKWPEERRWGKKLKDFLNALGRSFSYENADNE